VSPGKIVRFETSSVYDCEDSDFASLVLIFQHNETLYSSSSCSWLMSVLT
jgi:hypothetical protein